MGYAPVDVGFPGDAVAALTQPTDCGRFTILAEIPRLANGKLDKMSLRKRYEA